MSNERYMLKPDIYLEELEKTSYSHRWLADTQNLPQIADFDKYQDELHHRALLWAKHCMMQFPEENWYNCVCSPHWIVFEAEHAYNLEETDFPTNKPNAHKALFIEIFVPLFSDEIRKRGYVQQDGSLTPQIVKWAKEQNKFPWPEEQTNEYLQTYRFEPPYEYSNYTIAHSPQDDQLFPEPDPVRVEVAGAILNFTTDTTQPKKPLMLDNQKVQYQPATGFSRLGRDMQTGDYVDVPQASRRQGLYIIGANGTGKTGLIENLLLQDINQGLGVGLLDPHGDLTNAILAKMTKRLDDVILLDLADYNYPFGLNLFTCSDPTDLQLVSEAANKVMHIFKKLWGKGGIVVEDAWGVLLEEILRAATMTFLEYSPYEMYTMAEIPLLLENAAFRNHLVQKLHNRHVKNYWLNKYNRLSDKDQLEERRSTLNRVNAFLTQPLVEHIVGQATTTIDFRQVMNERKIVLVKLNNRMEDVTSLIGSIIIAEMLDAAYSRAALPVNKRKQFNLYADEFQRFATEDFATLLTEARKFGIATTIAHQARHQPGITDGIRAVSLQAANLVVFRVTSPDADELAGEFDITPQAAWEEELEEEWVEMTKEEWHERIEEEVTDGEEAVRVPKRDVVNHLLTHGHPNADVTKFVTEYLQFFKDHENTEADLAREAQKYPYEIHSHLGIDPTIARMTYGAKADGISKWEDTYDFPARVVKDILPRLNTLMYQWMISADVDKDNLWSEVLAIRGELAGILGYENYFETHTNPKTPQLQALLRRYREEEKAAGEWLRKHGDTALQVSRQNSPYNPKKAMNDLTEAGITLIMNKYKLSHEQAEKKFNRELMREIDFDSSIHDALEVLRKEPIMTESGRQQPRTRKQITYLTHPRETITHPRVAITHPQRTFQDMKNDIANQLASLPNFIARTRISVEGQTAEYTIKTLAPGQRIGKELQQRIATIQAQNRKPDQLGRVYCRSRKEVEGEITQRQASWNSSTSAQKQTPHVRQVPTCPNCGKSNSPGSLFCNQCGTKLM